MPLAGLLYKPFRSIDIRRWAPDEGREILYGKNHSCLPYFTVFMDYDDAELLRQCREGVALQPGLMKRISRKCGLMQIRKKHLWYCPVCAAEDFQTYGETYWRRLPQMPGVSYCTRHKTRLCENGLPVSGINYQVFPASYALLHIPDTDEDHQGNVFEEEFIGVAEDTEWLLENGFQLPDNAELQAAFEEGTGKKLNEHLVYPAGSGEGKRFEQYLAARILKESGRKNVGFMAQKCLSTLLAVSRSFGSFKDFWHSAR